MIGKEILNYIIVSQIGTGGMGSVYLAEHKFIKKQKVAIKVIKGDKFNEGSRSRLREEAEHLANLNHPNIVKFINYDIDDQGNIYLIMEYAEGMTLDQYINKKTGLIVESKILPLFEPILDAFEYAHKKKVVHRDIKPANIIITGEGTPKILDFGISTILDEAKDANKQESFIMGTPSYMSPEQVNGRGIDTRSDIYSLGVLLHQMLTGNAPYDTTTMSEVDIQEKVVNAPLPRMKSFYRYISDKAQAVVDKATAKNPKERYQTCAEFKKSLHKAIVKDPLPKSTVGIIAALLVLFIAVGGYFLDYSRVKVRYYKDYAEQWGVPQGIGRVTKSQKNHMARLYRFEIQHHKVQRVSQINSLGNIIDDDESERYERPIDQKMIYSASNKISQIKVFDQSGRCVYVKTYNDKLNTVVFQYDDEFGTEKSLSSQTIGYVNTFDAGQDSKSRISRWLLEYDENGYVTKIEYAGYQNAKVGDSDGIYGRTYVRDEKGRVLEERYQGFDGSPKATSWGLGMKKFKYDEEDNWVRSEYYSVDGKPALDDDGGLYIYELVYDQYGNVVKSYHKGYDEKLMLPKKNGIAAISNIFDEHGFNTSRTYLDVDEKPGYPSEGGFSKMVIEHDEYGYESKISCYDVEGNLCENSSGCATSIFKRDNHGNILEMWFYGIDGKITDCSEGYAGIKCKYDEIGQAIETVFYGTDGKPYLQEDGTAGYRREYNKLGLITKSINIDADLNPTYDDDGVSIIHIDYDQRGNIVKLSYYDNQDKALAVTNSKIAGWKGSYDDYGNQIEMTYFNVKEEACLHSDGNASWTSKYDEKGNRIQYRYYNLKKDLVLVSGVAGYNYIYDEKGNVLEKTPVGLDGKPSSTVLTVKYKYDENDNIIECAMFNENMKPALNNSDYHRYTCKYNNRNQQTEIRYYGIAGKLVKYNGDNYAIRSDEYNERGENIRTAFFGVDEKPIACKSGWASATQEYDAMGRSVRNFFYTTTGTPTDPETIVPEVIYKYDKWGNVIYTAAANGKGKLIKDPDEGWSIFKSEYDSRGNRLNYSFYDEKENPVKSKNGFHKCVTSYTTYGKEYESAYYGVNGESVKCDDGYHKSVYEFNENHNYLTYKVYDTEGKPVNTSSGFHKIEWIYGDDPNIAQTRKYYSVTGNVIYAESWNGSEWVADKTTVLRNLISNYNSSCPMDLGEDWGGMVFTSAKVISGSSVQFSFKVPYSKYELSYENQKWYKESAENFVAYLRDLMSNSVSMAGITTVAVVNDSKGRELCRFTK